MTKLITVRDLHLKETQVLVNNLEWRISVYGILTIDGKIMFQKNPHYSRLNLPGGSVEKGETLTEALTREFVEETGYSVKPTKLVDVQQDFFTCDNHYFHSITIFYEVKPTSSKIVKIDEQEGDSEGVVWLSQSEISLESIQPVFQKVIKDFIH